MLQARADRGEPTRLVDERPEVLSVAEPFLEAFLELDGQRIPGAMGGSSEIRREAVTDWLDENGILERDERAEYRRYIRLMDGIRMREMAKQMEAKLPKGKAH